MDQLRAYSTGGLVVGMIMVGLIAGDAVAAERHMLGELFTAPF